VGAVAGDIGIVGVGCVVAPGSAVVVELLVGRSDATV